MTRVIAIFLGMTTLLVGQEPTWTDWEKTIYSLGYQFGSDFKSRDVNLDPEIFMKGLKAGLAGESELNEDEMNKLRQQFFADMQKKQQEMAQKQATQNQLAAEAFLKENKEKAGVITTESGLQYRVITEGTGKAPTESDKVRVHYAGRLLDGAEFDSSIKRGQPAEFPVRGVIKGWQEALQLMKEGTKIEAYIPPELGYGNRGAPPRIPGNALLIFEMELLEVL